MKNKNGSVKHFAAGAALALLIVAAAPTGAGYFASLLAQEGGMPPAGGSAGGQMMPPPPMGGSSGGMTGGQMMPPPPMGGQQGGQFGGQMSGQMGGQQGGQTGGQMGGSQMGGQFGGQMSGQMGGQQSQFGGPMGSQTGFGNASAAGKQGFETQTQFGNQQPGFGTQTAGKTGPAGFEQKGSATGTQNQTNFTQTNFGSFDKKQPAGIIDPLFKKGSMDSESGGSFDKFLQTPATGSTGKFQAPAATKTSLKKDFTLDTETDVEDRDYENAFKSVLKNVDLKKKTSIGTAKSPAKLRAIIAERAQSLSDYVCSEDTGFDCETDASDATDVLMEVLSDKKAKAKDLVAAYIDYVRAIQDMVNGSEEEEE